MSTAHPGGGRLCRYADQLPRLQLAFNGPRARCACSSSSGNSRGRLRSDTFASWPDDMDRQAKLLEVTRYRAGKSLSRSVGVQSNLGSCSSCIRLLTNQPHSRGKHIEFPESPTNNFGKPRLASGARRKLPQALNRRKQRKQRKISREHEEIAGWIGADFDPEAFDLEWINRRLASLALSWKGGRRRRRS